MLVSYKMRSFRINTVEIFACWFWFLNNDNDILNLHNIWFNYLAFFEAFN